MNELMCNDPKIQRWAEIIVDFCTEVKPKERVEITGEIEGQPLILALYRRCLEVGAFPVIQPVFPYAAELFYKHASSEQLANVHDIDMFRIKNTDVQLHVMAETNTKSLNWVDPEKLTSVRRARREISKIRKETVRWNVTSYPTNAYAQDADMSLSEFTEFVFNAGFLNHSDALNKWKNLRHRQQKIIQTLQNINKIRIESSGCELVLGMEGRRMCESSGKVNMPDGEIYTGPVEDEVDGWIHFSFPGYYLGQVVEGIRLKFEKGKVVKASADTNETFLKKMLSTDPGALRIGELGIGTNWGIKKFTRNLLFDEKIGGTIHLALGDSYRETLGKNRSAIHWDILHDMRGDSRLYADDNLVMKNGQFTGRYAEIWNENN